MFTLLFAVGVQGRIDAKVHQLSLFVAAALAVACFAAFLYLIYSASKLLRPVAVLAHVGNSGIAVIKEVYPEPSLGPDTAESQRQKLISPDRVIQHRGNRVQSSASISAPLSSSPNPPCCVIELGQVGDFVAVDEQLFNLYGGARSIDTDVLHSAVDFGSERTLEQDPTFAFRILIDIALKALSPAINDPTPLSLLLTSFTDCCGWLERDICD